MGDTWRRGIFWLGVLVYAGSLVWFLVAPRTDSGADTSSLPVEIAARIVIGVGLVILVPFLTRILTSQPGRSGTLPGTGADASWQEPERREVFVRRVRADLELLFGAALIYMAINLVVDQAGGSQATWATLLFGACAIGYVMWLRLGPRYRRDI